MHPADKLYFKNFARSAKAAGLSLVDYYSRIQKGHTGFTQIVNPQAQLGLRYALKFIMPTDSCLVMGCGAGSEIQWLQKQGRLNLTGLDTSEESLALCRDKFKIETIEGDMCRTGLHDGTYDVVMARRCLHHLFYPFEAFQEFARVGKSHVILISEPVKTLLKKAISRLRGKPIISASNIYEYQFDLEDVHRYMAFNGYELAGCICYVENLTLSSHFCRMLNIVPGLSNRFTAVYKRM